MYSSNKRSVRSPNELHQDNDVDFKMEEGGNGVSEMIKAAGAILFTIGIILALTTMYMISINRGYNIAGGTGAVIFAMVAGGLILYLTTEEE
jgi:hypothetical protein